jgi:hypothetical protein
VICHDSPPLLQAALSQGVPRQQRARDRTIRRKNLTFEIESNQSRRVGAEERDPVQRGPVEVQRGVPRARLDLFFIAVTDVADIGSAGRGDNADCQAR